MSKTEPNIGFVLPNQSAVPMAAGGGYVQSTGQYQPSSHQPFPQPIQIQPSFANQNFAPPTNWMNQNFQSYLMNSTSFVVKQKVDLIEVVLDWEVQNKYIVKDQFGNKIFFAGEQSECLSRQCFDSHRPFTMFLKDSMGSDVLVIERPLRCTQFCCCLCYPQELKVSTPNGILLGSIVEEWSIFSQKFAIKNAAGTTVLRIEGPFMPCAFRCQNVVFKLLSLDGVQIGRITKEFGGFVREMITSADTFSINFPADLAPEIKAVALGALFLIDFMFFENNH